VRQHEGRDGCRVVHVARVAHVAQRTVNHTRVRYFVTGMSAILNLLSFP
jgi:uncharacterized membrane protein YuzA (DUF378 family)